MNTTQAYIAIEGVIGVGKTTLARMFQKEIEAQLVLEVFEENPFLSSFYTDRARYAFQTQIFFLLSRYHQQRQLAAIPRPVISDYMFEKDRLFAQVNLAGDELQTYYSVQEALAENIRHPDLVVYLRADTDTLISRITDRDRPYERNMEPAYIESLRAAYEQFFGTYAAGSVLIIDTNNADFVRNPDDRETIFNRIRGAIGNGPRQPALPGLETAQPSVSVGAGERSALEQTSRRLSDFQQFHRQLDHDQPLFNDPYFNFILLQEEIGELARAFLERLTAGLTGQPDPSPPSIRAELADVLAHLIKLANLTSVDLEEAYLAKMRHTAAHERPDTPGAESEGA
jgi:deoxyadenosine/deoxycytidine kinase/NTP pyrophosphatase (non-canonical NTP hydrolase)